MNKIVPAGYCLKIVILLIATSTFAKAETTKIVVPVNLHIVQSRITEIGSQLSVEEANALISRANEIWAQANVVWQVLEVKNRKFPEDQLAKLLKEGRRLSPDRLLEMIVGDVAESHAIDVSIVRNLARIFGAPGIYLDAPGVVIVSDLDPAGLDDPGRILAHELGHALGLVHVLCTERGNLMSPGCYSRDRTRLSERQVGVARERAGEWVR